MTDELFCRTHYTARATIFVVAVFMNAGFEMTFYGLTSGVLKLMIAVSR